VPAFPLDIVTNLGVNLGRFQIKNTNANSDAQVCVTNNSNNFGVFFKTGSTYTTYKTIASNDLGFFNSSLAGNISLLNDNTSGNILLTAGGSSTAHITLHNTGNLLVGTTTNSGERLQVTGTMKVTGASSFGGNMTLTLNQNASTILTISNTTSGLLSDANIVVTSSNGSASLSKASALKSAYKTFLGNDALIYNSTAGDISVLNDWASGNIKFAAGGSSTAHMTIKSNGRINMSSLPTSSTGLATGDLWNNGGVINIV
jgi:hypothetical protein